MSIGVHLKLRFENKGGLCKGFIGQQHNVQTPGLIDQEETGTRHVFGSSHPSSLQCK